MQRKRHLLYGKRGGTMEVKSKEKELVLCGLLNLALHADQSRLHADSQKIKQQKIDWKSILLTADNHRVLPLLYDILKEILPEDGAEWKRVQERSTQTVRQSYRLLFRSRYVTGVLKEAGIDVILLKKNSLSDRQEQA